MEIIRAIRYANASRFALPQRCDSCESVDAVIPPQRESRLCGVMGAMEKSAVMDEDCHILSVFTPSREGKYPVMVWICGGAFVTGGGEYARYDSSALCREHDIVVVNVTYRLGALGFLYRGEDAPHNLGLEDQICALEWVKAHISEYGGDPDNVTVCGQSAGAYSIANIISRGRDDLFSKAILFSAPYSIEVSARQAAATMRELLRRLRRITPQNIEEASVANILAAQQALLKASHKSLTFSTVGEKVLPDAAWKPRLRKMLLTCQKNDAQAFLKHRLLEPVVTSMLFRKPMERYASAMRGMGVDVQTQVLDYHPDNGHLRACHNMELPFLFECWDAWKKAGMMQGISREEYELRSLEFRRRIADFILER